MNKMPQYNRLSFDLPDEEAALSLAQKIANASGKTVIVVDSRGDAVGTVSQTTNAEEIARVQKLANLQDARYKK
jgi:CBS-domain-containing membrane protein